MILKVIDSQYGRLF